MFKLENTGVDHLGNYLTYYSFEGSVFDIIDDIIQSGLEFSKVFMYDDGDVGLKYFGGEYTWDEFLNTYERVCCDIGYMVFEIANNVGRIIINVPDGSLFFSREDSTLDLNHLIQQRQESNLL